jgi:hypothetical protein
LNAQLSSRRERLKALGGAAVQRVIGPEEKSYAKCLAFSKSLYDQSLASNRTVALA